jgi:ABC-2 type transport system permease protein
MLRIIFFVPIIQLMVLGYAARTDVERVALDVYDFDRSRESRELVDALCANDYFVLAEHDASPLSQPVFELDRRFKTGAAEMALVIPNDFSQSLTADSQTTVGLIADGTDASSAGIALGYANRIMTKYATQVTGFEPPVEVRPNVLYNPETESVYFMVPGIVATLLTMITVMLTAMAIVREKEVGTLEQLLVTPITTTALLAGKLTAFAVLGLFEISVALTVGVLWFEIPFAGSPLLLFALSGIYLLSTLGMGLFISTLASTQQQAMFYAWFFSIFAILTSGFMTPISNMPEWMQNVTYINPMRYFVSIVRGVILRGAGATDLVRDIYPLLIFGLAIFGFASLRFRKRIS